MGELLDLGLLVFYVDGLRLAFPRGSSAVPIPVSGGLVFAPAPDTQDHNVGGATLEVLRSRAGIPVVRPICINARPPLPDSSLMKIWKGRVSATPTFTDPELVVKMPLAQSYGRAS